MNENHSKSHKEINNSVFRAGLVVNNAQGHRLNNWNKIKYGMAAYSVSTIGHCMEQGGGIAILKKKKYVII